MSEQLQLLRVKLVEVKAISGKIRTQNVTQKTTGGKYPIRKGYATAVRRPVQDILSWMSGIEGMLEIMLKECET